MKPFAFLISALLFVGTSASMSRTLHYKCTKPGKIAITFDDGPAGTKSQRAIDALVQHGVPGIFFINGRNLKLQEDVEALVRMAETPDMIVAHHTQNHVNALNQKWPTYEDYYVDQLEREAHEVEKVLGYDPMEDFLRPPYLAYNMTLFDHLRSHRGYTIVGESLNPRDWDPTETFASIMNTLKTALSNGTPDRDSFISLHHPRWRDAEEMYQILDEYITYGKSLGYTFVSIKDCLGMN